MAPRMKLWLGLVLGGAAFAAVQLVPPSAMPAHDRNVSVAEFEYQTLRGELLDLHEALKRVRWMDSLPAAVVANVHEGVAVLSPASTTLPSDFTSRMAELARVERDRYAPDGAKVVFGFVYQEVNHGAHSGLPPRFGHPGEVELYAGTHEDTPYCLQVRPMYSDGLAAERALHDAETRVEEGRYDVFHGLCRHYVRNGLPGPRVGQWLADGALEFGRHQAGRWTFEERRENYRLRWAGLPFGIDRAVGAPDDVDAARCLVGLVDGCGAALLEPERHDKGASWARYGAPVLHAQGFGGRTSFGNFDDYIFDDLERQFGADAFARFWTSELPVAEAFADAFGVEVGPWTREWARASFGDFDSGPGLPRQARLPSLLTISLMVGIAVLAAVRRKVA